MVNLGARGRESVCNTNVITCMKAREFVARRTPRKRVNFSSEVFLPTIADTRPDPYVLDGAWFFSCCLFCASSEGVPGRTWLWNRKA